MSETGSAASFLPERLSLTALREAARGCTACPLWRCGTQTVFGEGLKRASMVLVGEQPGDREDLAGRPFVGPAGRLLHEALAEAGIERSEVYLTNAVKHFKWKPRGKRRIHQKPRALLGRDVRVTRDRGRPLDSPLAPIAFATVHPSSILRAPDREARRREEALFVEDLRVAAAAVGAER